MNESHNSLREKMKMVPTLNLVVGELSGGAPALFAGSEPIMRCRNTVVGASYGMTEESITLEGASIAANLIALGQLMVVSDEREDESNKLIQYNQFYGLKDALKGQVNFIIDTTQPDGYRSLTEEEKATLKPAARRHPDEEAIRNLID